MTQYFHMLITTVLPLLILSCQLCHLVSGDSEISSFKCFDEEWNALLQFKHGIIQDNCGLLTSWRNDSDCCQWDGVHCSNHTGHVTMLRLQSSYTNIINFCMQGKVSPSLRELKHLRHLDLGFNFFTPPIPSFLGSLTNLEYLNLRYAFEFYSGISSHRQNLKWLSRLRLLRYLDLSGTDLSETENVINIISELPFLGVLRMDHCQLPINIPSSLTHINSSSNLRLISVSGNNFNYSSMFQWLSNLPGVTTHLVYLDLSENSFQGPIPNDLWNLHHLSYLDLSSNQLNGSVPNEFGNLHHLSHLDLSYNHLEGRIPIEFESMESLSYLSLSNNNLHGSFKIFSKLCNLEQLNLGANNFTDEITIVIGALSSCKNATLLTLDLSKNHFWGVIPDSISSLTTLRELYLGDNQISQISECIGQLTMLETLEISSNSLKDTLTHTHFLNLSRLRELYLPDNPRLVIDLDASWIPPFQLDGIDLRSCKLGPYFPNWLYMQTNFSHFDVSNAEMSGNINVSFWNSLPLKLNYLNMSSNQFSGLIPFIPNIHNSLFWVDLSSNLFEGVIPSWFTIAGELYLNDNKFSDSSYIFCSQTPSNLLRIDLSNNLLSGKLSDCWMVFVHLLMLHLENNRFSGSVPKSIGTLKNLQYLHLDNNSFSGPIPTSLANCTSLVILNLGYNSFTGNIPLFIGKVGVLILRKNNFSAEVPATFCQLSSLQILDFAMNHFSGVIPRCIGNLTAIMLGNTDTFLFQFPTESYSSRQDSVINPERVYTTLVTWKKKEQLFKSSLRFVKSIDFSYNELSGKIPDGIWNLTGLVSLDLSENNISGRISSKIGQLTALEFLDLSGNHLTGNIPDSLAELNSLAILGLSNNNLSGKIPVGTQLQSFNASSYTGNRGLCGAPLLKCPGDQAELNAPIGSNSTTVQEKHKDYDLFLLGLYISIVLGFITGFWVVCGTLVIKRSWRHAWFRLIQDTHDRFYDIALGIIPQVWKKPRH